MWNVSFEQGRTQCRLHSEHNSVYSHRALLFILRRCSVGNACATVSWSHMSGTALQSNMPFYTVSVQAAVVSAQNIGLRCDYGEKMLKYSSTSKAEREMMHWKLMLFRGLGSPRGALTPLWVQLNHFYSTEDKLQCTLDVWMRLFVPWGRVWGDFLWEKYSAPLL